MPIFSFLFFLPDIHLGNSIPMVETKLGCILITYICSIVGMMLLCLLEVVIVFR